MNNLTRPALLTLWAFFALRDPSEPFTARKCLDLIESALAGDLDTPQGMLEDLTALDWRRAPETVTVGKP